MMKMNIIKCQLCGSQEKSKHLETKDFFLSSDILRSHKLNKPKLILILSLDAVSNIDINEYQTSLFPTFRGLEDNGFIKFNQAVSSSTVTLSSASSLLTGTPLSKHMMFDYAPRYYSDNLKKIDKDTIIDEKDICDNSLKGSNIDKYGCKKEESVEVVLPVKTVAPVITPKEIKPIVYNSFKDKFLNAPEGFTLGVATFSQEKEAQRFLDKYNTQDNMLAIPYRSKVSQKTNIKVVYGIYETLTQSKDALSKLPKALRIHKPYIENIYSMQDLYNKNN